MYIVNMKKKLTSLALALAVLAAPAVLARGLLLLDKNQLSFAIKPNTSVESVVKLSSGATFDQPFQFTSDSPWLTANPSEGVVPARKSVEIKIKCDAKDMKPGFYIAQAYVKEISQDPMGGAIADLSANLRVYEESLQLDFVPRSLEIKPGQILTVTVKNNNEFQVNLKLKPELAWLTIYPPELEIGSNESSTFVVRASNNAQSGGTFKSTAVITTEGFEVRYPISCFVDCGVVFNPPELSKPGIVILTNKTQKTVFVEIPKNNPSKAETDPPGRIKIEPKESKTVSVKFPTEKNAKPDKIEFKIANGFKKSYIMEIK